MEQNKTGKYFKYAIGEIVLVVIGILIALSINNWNQNRLERIEEMSILKNIHDEFLQNKVAFDSVFKANNECYEAGLIIMDLIGESKESLLTINTDSLIYRAIEFQRYNPSENAISDLIQSGRLQVLRNQKIKDLIHKWSRTMKTATENFESFDVKIEMDLIPYLTNIYPFKNIDYYGPLNWKSKSVLENDKLKIFQDLKYENLVDDTLYRLRIYMDTLKGAEIIIENIIEETK